MRIRVINKSTNPLPAYETELSAGMDLRAFISEEITIKPLQRIVIPTGLYMELEKGFEAQIRPRSGLALKHGITVLNSPGTIDADYRGEIKILLINLSDTAFTIKIGDRIAQMIISKHELIGWEDAVSLNETSRGAGGYGHTGV